VPGQPAVQPYLGRVGLVVTRRVPGSAWVEFCEWTHPPRGPILHRPRCTRNGTRCIPLHCVAASYDMGWQVRSPGGKYGSLTGHGLLVRAISKKVLDSVVYNKKCGTCMRHYSPFSNYDNVKTHKCVTTMKGCQRQWRQRG